VAVIVIERQLEVGSNPAEFVSGVMQGHLQIARSLKIATLAYFFLRCTY
jgi:hypothetical protein